MFYSLVKKTELEKVLDKTEVFATLLASLGHDINHSNNSFLAFILIIIEGYNNAYESKTKSQNSILYYDYAILESMHASYLIRILKDPEINFLEGITDLAVRTSFIKLFFDLLLEKKPIQGFGSDCDTGYRYVKT